MTLVADDRVDGQGCDFSHEIQQADDGRAAKIEADVGQQTVIGGKQSA